MADASTPAAPRSAEQLQKNRQLQQSKLFQGRAPSVQAAADIEALLITKLPLRPTEQRAALAGLCRSALTGRLLAALDPATSSAQRLELVNVVAVVGVVAEGEISAELQQKIVDLERQIEIHVSKISRHTNLWAHLCSKLNARVLGEAIASMDIRDVHLNTMDRALVSDGLVASGKRGRPVGSGGNAADGGRAGWHQKAELIMKQWDQQA